MMHRIATTVGNCSCRHQQGGNSSSYCAKCKMHHEKRKGREGRKIRKFGFMLAGVISFYYTLRPKGRLIVAWMAHQQCIIESWTWMKSIIICCPSRKWRGSRLKSSWETAANSMSMLSDKHVTWPWTVTDIATNVQRDGRTKTPERDKNNVLVIK